METKIENEILANGHRKVTLGVRCYAELKGRVFNEAVALGVTGSEHAETMLINYEKLVTSVTFLKEELEKARKALNRMTLAFHIFKITSANGGRIEKTELERIFGISFDEKEMRFDGFYFRRVFLNSGYYEMYEY